MSHKKASADEAGQGGGEPETILTKVKGKLRIYTEATLVPLGAAVSVMLVMAGGAVWLTEFYRDFRDAEAQTKENTQDLVSLREMVKNELSQLNIHMAVQNERARVTNDRLEAIEYGRRKARH